MFLTIVNNYKGFLAKIETCALRDRRKGNQYVAVSWGNLFNYNDQIYIIMTILVTSWGMILGIDVKTLNKL